MLKKNIIPTKLLATILFSCLVLFLSYILLYLWFDAKGERGSTIQYYKLRTKLSNNCLTQNLFKERVDQFFSQEIVYCSTEDNLQKKVNESIGKTLILKDGLHKSYCLDVPSNIKIVIPKNATIKLADDCLIDQSSYAEAVGDAVIRLVGTEKKLAENIFIELDGVIDGNKSNHPYAKGGVEGIDLKWIRDSCIYGSGIIRNANGDGLDIDTSSNCYVEGITLSNNDGCGIHFGSPRPIASSFDNVVVRCYSKSNGFLHKRAGFDHSWPMINAVTYFDCIAEDNYQNWDIRGFGALVLNSRSKSIDKRNKKDFFGETLFQRIQTSEGVRDEYSSQTRVNETGYYLISARSLKSKHQPILIVNGEKFYAESLVSQSKSHQSRCSIMLLNEGDEVEVGNVTNELNFPRNESETTEVSNNTGIRLDLIAPLSDFYPESYKFKIFNWRFKTEVESLVYKSYSLLFK